MSQFAVKHDSGLVLVKENSLLVTWQQPATRSYFLMGNLRREADGRYLFTYYPGVENQPDFRPIPGFPDTEKVYESRVLFPLFSSRIMSLKRPDRPEWLESLGLSEEAEPFEILGRSLGLRVADTIEVYPEPDVDLARKTVIAEVPIHGLRYQDAGMELLERGGIVQGDTLVVERERENAHDPRALAVRTAGGVKLGFVPAPILDYLDRGGFATENAAATAVHVNPRQYGHHQRLILKITWRF